MPARFQDIAFHAMQTGASKHVEDFPWCSVRNLAKCEVRGNRRLTIVKRASRRLRHIGLLGSDEGEGGVA